MKSFGLSGLASVVCVALLAAALPSFAQQGSSATQPREEPATKFERFLLSKGTVRIREFYPIGELAGDLGTSANFEVVRAYTPGKSDYVLALRVQIKESGRVPRERIGVLDAEEVTSLVSALPQMAKMLDTLKTEALSKSSSAQSTEVDFRGGTFTYGFFTTKGDVPSLYMKAGEIGPATAYFAAKDFAQIQSFLSQGDAKIKALKGK